uniref:Galectin-3 n=2 Tax=Lygus hesperus TaxID=30085 RepID=A0A0A9W731_LYGHE
MNTDEPETETTTDDEGIPAGQKAIVAAPAFVDNAPPPAGEAPPPSSSGPSPPGPPPTPDGIKDDADFPLYDNAVLTELREADERAAKAAKAIEAVREQLAVYAKKDEMTDEDIKMMEEKQKELMAKMEEFEEITKKVQHLVGLVDVASSQLGPPQKQMLPNVEGEKPPGTGASSQPEDTLPKVIVCGTGDIDQVPKIIVCEPTKARDGKHPLYHQIQGKQKEGTSKTALQEPSGRTTTVPSSVYPGGFPSGYPGSPSGYPGGYPGPPGGYPGSPGGYPGAPGGYPGAPGSPSGYPGSLGYPGGMGGYPGQTFPGSDIYGMGGPGMSGYPGPGMVGPQSMMLPGGLPVPVCSPCLPNKPKKHKSHKKKGTCPAVCPENCQELGEMLEATLNMSEKLAEQNTELEGSRYELQEAVLNKDKQYDGLALQLDSMKMELKNVKNENRYLKNMVAKNAQNHGGQGDQQTCSYGEKAGMKKTGGLCRKDLNTMPMCKAQAYKEMGLPIPRPDNKPPCPGAKFAASMGWNENQGCRNELNKSVNCPDMQGTGGNTPGCVCSTKGPSQCPMHCGRSANHTRPMNMGSGDVGGANCPCGCLGQVAQCKKADMEAVVQTMEQEVKSLQKELELVQAERRGLALQKKLLNCMADTGTGGPYSGARSLDDGPSTGARNQPPPNKPLVLLQKPTPENLSAVELQLNSLREQYRKLQEDYNAKVEEVSMVRVEYEAAKRDALALLEKCREAEARVDDLLERLRIIELEKNKMAGSKDQMMELDQQLILAKQRYREGQEELEEIKTTMQDQMLQLEEYRNKYLTAQQTVEEQRRQIDIMELENNRISEQVNLEIQRVKTQFQEKLQELTPLPDC